jgi:hypothetical protein
MFNFTATHFKALFLFKICEYKCELRDRFIVRFYNNFAGVRHITFPRYHRVFMHLVQRSTTF